MLLQQLVRREMGLASPRLLCEAEAQNASLSLQLHPTWPRLSQPLSSEISCLALEDIDYRYLLVGTRGGHVHVLDTDVTRRPAPPSGPGRRARVVSAPRHRFAVSAVQWYARDTGMFYSASYDRTVCVVDANAGEVVWRFPFEERVEEIAVSRTAAHGLVAAALSAPHLRLCDVRTGSATHQLTGPSEYASAPAACCTLHAALQKTSAR